MTDTNDAQTKPQVDMGEIGLKLAELYHLRDEEFCASANEKNRKIKRLVDELLKIIPDPSTCNENIKAQLHYYIGKTWDALPSYQKDAETHLSKAVKFNPSLHDAWLCLGHSYWKNDNLPRALECLQTAVELAPQDKCALREMARVLRLSGTNPQERKESVEQSVETAKKAVGIDLKDGNSWYVLGNCYLSFFINTINTSYLKQSMKGYQQAIANGQTGNPDLLYNQAVVYKYMGKLTEACDGFESAFQTDLSLLAALESCLAVRQLLANLDKRIKTKGGIPHRNLERQLTSMQAEGSSKAVDKLGMTFQPMTYFTDPKKPEEEAAKENTPPPTAESGSGSKNKNAVIATGKDKKAPVEYKTTLNVKILNLCSREGETPVSYAVIDKNQVAGAMMVFCVGPAAIKEGDELWIPDPTITKFDATVAPFKNPAVIPPTMSQSMRDLLTEGTQYNFNLLTVANPCTILVNGKPIPPERLLLPQMTVHAFT
eukprot:TRINITY_DN67746_c2_g1_i1.p1 TRINITY_DN67746_c2_g1~~TRINITY_DN67746_c2_g1_i1.p1  ORF type:complete len:487 (+),score=50.24 TRINITY_DN67746_c2_g1_i1:117-1577(+)